MASVLASDFVLPYPATLCPPPLHLRKKARRTLFPRRILHKSIISRNQYTHGPLDDIIAEIKSDIRETSPSCEPVYPVFLDQTQPFKTPSTWAATPLPVSRAPKDQPLTIRKNRNSRSSASGSSVGDPMSFSRNSSQDENGCTGGTSPPSGMIPWPLFLATDRYEPGTNANDSNAIVHDGHTTARRSLEEPAEHKEGQSAPIHRQRFSRLRLFTSGFPRLRRSGTGETSAGTDDVSVTISPISALSVIGAKALGCVEDTDEPNEQAEHASSGESSHE
jgi:hypothetical protein